MLLVLGEKNVVLVPIYQAKFRDTKSSCSEDDFIVTVRFMWSSSKPPTNYYEHFCVHHCFISVTSHYW